MRTREKRLRAGPFFAWGRNAGKFLRCDFLIETGNIRKARKGGGGVPVYPKCEAVLAPRSPFAIATMKMLCILCRFGLKEAAERREKTEGFYAGRFFII